MYSSSRCFAWSLSPIVFSATPCNIKLQERTALCRFLQLTARFVLPPIIVRRSEFSDVVGIVFVAIWELLTISAYDLFSFITSFNLSSNLLLFLLTSVSNGSLRLFSICSSFLIIICSIFIFVSSAVTSTIELS